jgi:uncharacterized membrane protein
MLVWLGAAVYATAFSAESVFRHSRYDTGFDTAIYDQRLWLLAHGHEPFSTILDRSLLGNHFEPGVVTLTPLYWLSLGVPALLVVQSLALALVAPGLYAIACNPGAPRRVAALTSLLWLVSPWTASVNLFEFHPEVIAAPLLVLSTIAALRERWFVLGATATVAMSFKEDISWTYLALGAVLALRGSRVAGPVLVVFSALWFFVAEAIVRLHGDSYAFFERRFAGSRGDTFREAVAWMGSHPLQTVADVVSQSGPAVFLLVLATGAFALLAPRWLLLPLPALMHNALSAYQPQHSLTVHYHLFVATGLFIAAAIGVGRLASLGRTVRLVLGGVVGVSLMIAVIGGSFVSLESARRNVVDPAQLTKALSLVPPDVPVAASVHALPHLSHRTELYTLPEPFIPIVWGGSSSPTELHAKARRVRFVVFVAGDRPSEYPDNLDRVLPRLGANFVEIYAVGPIRLFERRAD